MAPTQSPRPHLAIGWLLALAILLIGLPPAVATAQVDAIDVDGPAVAERSDDVVYVWTVEPVTVRVTTAGEARSTSGTVCLDTRLSGEAVSRRLACESIDSDDDGTVAFAFDRWPENLTGRQVLTASERGTTTDATTSPTDRLTLLVLSPDADLDEDGLPNREEVSVGANVSVADTDGDGLVDGEEVQTYGTSPTAPDTDGDGLGDRAELTRHQTNPTSADTDDDGLDDRVEVETHGTNPTRPDTDGDGLADPLEVNTYETDPTDPDTDGDGLDDRVEVETHQTNPSRSDTDGDGVTDALEVSTYASNPTNPDTDGDGLVDGVEVETHGTDPTSPDTDGDGLADGAEVARYGTNPTAVDTDNDGLADGHEVQRFGTDPTSVDSDGDGVADRDEVPAVLSILPRPVELVAVLVLVGLLVVIGALVRGGYVSRSRLVEWSSWRSSVPRRVRSTWRGWRGDASDGEFIADVSPEVLSNEHQVLALLADNDGRMRQTAIVDQTGWSKAKVSRVLSKMAADGDVVKIDVGSGNVVAEPGKEPPGVGPPFED